MTRRLPLGALLSLGIVTALAVPATAGQLRDTPKAVIELFTSQGCSSCPPADVLLEEMARRKDVVALAYHVDYWDYIGWVDTFGNADNTDRQKGYAAGWKDARIYTPQLVINGESDVVGSRRDEVSAALDAATLPLPVKLGMSEGMLSVDIDGQAGLDDAMVILVTYIDRADVEIERGENAGKMMSYAQVVTGKQVIGMWEAGSGTHLKLPIKEILVDPANGAAILVQQELDGMPGPIIGAASYQP